MYWDGLESLFEEKGHQRESQWMQWEKWKSRDSFRDLFAPEWMEKDNGTKVLASLETISSSLSKPRLFFLLMVLDTLECRWCHEQQKVNIKIKSHLSHDWAKNCIFLPSSVNIHSFDFGWKKREIKSSFVFFRFTSCRLFIFLLHHT